MASNALPLILGAGALFLLMGKKKGSTGGNGGTGDDGADGTGDDGSDDTGDDGSDDTGDDGSDDAPDGGGGGIGKIGGIAGTGTTKPIVRSVPFSSIVFGGGALGDNSACGRIVMRNLAGGKGLKVGDTLEITGWPSGTYGITVGGGGQWYVAKDRIEAKAVSSRLLVTLTSGGSAPSEFYISFRGGAGLPGGATLLRHLYFTGEAQTTSMGCADAQKQV